VESNVPPEIVSTGRIVLLGASNVTRSLPTIVETARRAWYPPLDILGAAGHGRSFGADSSILGRKLPGIISCGLWDALKSRAALPTAALVTDIGNDLVYGEPPDQIIEWLEICLQQLADVAQRLVITRLPVETIEAAPPWKFQFLGHLLYPSAPLDRERILVEARAMNDWLVSCANRFRAYILQPDPDWYGWDPIHIARTPRDLAWRKILAPWSDGRAPQPNHASFARSRAIRRARPAQWHQFGIPRRCPQPSVQLADGTRLSLF